MSDITDRNNTSAPALNYERLKGLKWTENDLELYHQFLVRHYLLENPRQRGMLAFHATGTGKSRLGANNIKEYVKSRQIVVIAPKKVFATFEREFKTVGVDANDVHFISLKANNLGTQIERLPGNDSTASVEPVESDTVGGMCSARPYYDQCDGGREHGHITWQYDHDKAEDIDTALGGAGPLEHSPLDNTFLVIDEAHNLFNAIVNGGQNAVDLYDRIMAAKNLKVLFLTGTPISNSPFELVPCFNMLAGHRLFPENSEDFEKFFISKDGNHVNNADKFKNRIFGLVSYYGEWVQAVQRLHRPTRLPTKVIQVPMSAEVQYPIYSGYRDKEREERGSMGPRGNERFAPKISSSTYRIRSRQASNFVPDEKDKKHRGLQDPARCPKFYKALEIIESHKDQPGIICSNFVNDCGLRDMAHVLRLKGWEEWDGETMTKNTKRYAIVAGDVDEDDVSRIQRVASAMENIKAGIIRVVLVGPAGAEGIEFLHFRWGIIMDPFFNGVRADQFEARIDRFKSHVELPKSEQNVQMYHLLAAYPEGAKKEDVAKEPTTDNDLYAGSKRRKLLSLEFYRLMIEASIDCPIHRDTLPKDRAAKMNCLMCSPTNQPLFTNRIDKDCKSANPCHPPRVDKIEAKEIIIETASGQKRFMYTHHKKTKDTPDHFEFFEYREDLGGYVPVLRNHKEYDLLMETLRAN